jgi:hypothetical protein
MKIPLLLLLSLMAYSAKSAAVLVTITTSTLPNGTVGTSYSAVITTQGGCTPFVWSSSGTLPAGVQSRVVNNTRSLDLSGAPTSAASYSFTVSVRGCGGHVAEQTYTVVIQPAPVHVVNLSWTASTSADIAGYNMYRGPDGMNWQKINSGGLIASTLYTDSTVANGTTYYYAATAVNISGEESAKSVPIQVVVP